MRIQDHRLAWRWTDPKYAVLPNAILEQMHPANAIEAKALHNRALSFLGRDGLNPALSPNRIGTDELGLEQGTTWLKQQQSHLEQMVFLSWDLESALRTTWGVFASYWSEFCYPTSDDLVVFPESEAWALLYHHEQEFQFGRRVISA